MGSGSSFGSVLRRRGVSSASVEASFSFRFSSRSSLLDFAGRVGSAAELLAAGRRAALAELAGARAGYSGKSEMLTASEPRALSRSAARRLRSESMAGERAISS